MAMIYTTALSLITNLAVLVATSNTGEPWWVSLVVSIASPLVYLLASIGLNALLTHLKNKGKLTSKQAKELQKKVDDYVDDGKINHSNEKEDKDNGNE